MEAKSRRSVPGRTGRRADDDRRAVAAVVMRAGMVAAIGALAIAAASNLRPREHGVVTVAAAATSTTGAPTTTTVVLATKPTAAFCDLLRNYLPEAQRVTVSLNDPAVLRPMLDDALGAATRSASVATLKAAPDVATVRTVLADLKAGFEAAGYDFAKVPPDVALRLMSPQFASSLGRLQSLASEGC